MGQINQLTEKWLANSLGNGNVSILDYSRQFSIILQVVISSTLTTIMVPLLAKSFAKGDKQTFENTIKENLTIIFVIMCLTVPFLIGSASPISIFFFQNKNISEIELQKIIHLMRLYGFALIGIILYLNFGLILLSSNKGKSYALWGILSQIIVFFINIIFINKIGLYVFPLSLGVSHFIVACILSYLIEIDNRMELYFRILRYLLMLLFISLILYLINSFSITDDLIFQMVLNVFILLMTVLIFLTFLDVSIFQFLRKSAVRFHKKMRN